MNPDKWIAHIAGVLQLEIPLDADDARVARNLQHCAKVIDVSAGGTKRSGGVRIVSLKRTEFFARPDRRKRILLDTLIEDDRNPNKKIERWKIIVGLTMSLTTPEDMDDIAILRSLETMLDLKNVSDQDTRSAFDIKVLAVELDDVFFRPSPRNWREFGEEKPAKG